VLGENGKLYDSKKGQSSPDGVGPMPLLTDADLKTYPELKASDVVPGYVARYWDMMSMADKTPVEVIGENGMLKDKPGFEVSFVTRTSASDAMHQHDRPSVLMPMRGHWRVTWEGGSATLAPGDTMSVPEGLAHSAVPSMTGEASLFHVVATDDPAGATWNG
jgi:quercetin dioxygenase-like cupin family protein